MMAALTFAWAGPTAPLYNIQSSGDGISDAFMVMLLLFPFTVLVFGATTLYLAIAIAKRKSRKFGLYALGWYLASAIILLALERTRIGYSLSAEFVLLVVALIWGAGIAAIVVGLRKSS